MNNLRDVYSGKMMGSCADKTAKDYDISRKT